MKHFGHTPSRLFNDSLIDGLWHVNEAIVCKKSRLYPINPGETDQGEDSLYDDENERGELEDMDSGGPIPWPRRKRG